MTKEYIKAMISKRKLSIRYYIALNNGQFFKIDDYHYYYPMRNKIHTKYRRISRELFNNLDLPSLW